MSTRKVHGKRSFTGNHPLLPAMGPAAPVFVPKVPTYTFLKWTFGRGSVIWKIWPAILLHTLFAAAIVYTWVATGRKLEIPNVMLTVMGVVIGFVISYRAMSGYDRYWMGRTAWTDVIRNARTMGRLIWYHVPLRLVPAASGTGTDPRTPHELGKVMAEKRMALDLVEAFAVALKHHLRGEVGIYYEDLYDLVRPLHDFTDPSNPHPTVASAVPAPLPAAAVPSAGLTPPTPVASTSTDAAMSTGTDATLKPTSTHASKRPSGSDLGTGTSAQNPGHTSQTSLHQPLLPAMQPGPEEGVLRRVAPDVIPFAGVFSGVGGWLSEWWTKGKDIDSHRSKDRSSRMQRRMRTWTGPIHPSGLKELEGFEVGENLPEEVLRCLSEWVSVLEERGTVPGTSLGGILGGIQQFEMSLTTLEHILTTPLPFVYSVHIRHVVWLYLFLLPLQLVSEFGWHTVPAVSVGAFVYLGFVAAGEEIEQPFGYDDNDLDLDMFCRDIIRQDIRCLKKAPCLNAWFPPLAPGVSVTPAPPQNDILAPESTGHNNDDTLTNANTNANGNGKTKDVHANARPGSNAVLGAAGTAYGGNMYRASLASLSDTLEDEENGTDDTDEEGEDGEDGEDEAGEDADGNGVEGRVREGELVDVR